MIVEESSDLIVFYLLKASIIMIRWVAVVRKNLLFKVNTFKVLMHFE